MPSVVTVARQSDGVLLTLPSGTLQLQVWSDSVIRVTFCAGAEISTAKSLSVIAATSATKWDERETPDAVTLRTQFLLARVDKQSGAVAFFDPEGKLILKEDDHGREISPAVQPGVAGTLVRQSFVLPADEAIYGLGQHQQGVWNYHGHAVRLLQENREVGVPVILSSKGYMLLWDNPAVTEISVGAPLSTPDFGELSRAATQPTARGREIPPAGTGEGIIRWSSETGRAIDYYFIYGPAPDAAMREYRALTGDAPLMPQWLWGFFQCKERYRTQEEVLSIAKQYRDLKIPIDGIIQDWRYWPDNSWGSHDFDKSRYPDPAAMFQQLHEEHFHALISVWPKFDLGTPNSDELRAAGAMYDPIIPYVFPPGRGQWYDPFNPMGREIYWKQISSHLFSLGVDGWWLDAPEPELSGKWGEFRTFTTANGPGAQVFNAYPLMHSSGIYQGQRAQTDEKRVVILTRSAYAGQQRNSAITWSGDIGSTWQVLKNQIPAGLNFSLSGIPYWNTDIGGFSGRMNPADPRYEELFTRWFQFGAFCPMFRVHGSAPSSGTGPGKELWRFDPRTQAICTDAVNLRYRLLPYIYSTSWQVTSKGYTMMRPLVMDFPNDPQALAIGDQYLFGPAIMVSPVTSPGAATRSVYLPPSDGGWFNFWTGDHLTTTGRIDAAAPIERVPLFVRAGSIVPMGPMIQYTGEKPADPLELRVYPGANANFVLYEDEGDSYRYEKGAYSTILISWDDTSHTLIIGARKGEFPGMLKTREIQIVWVSPNHGGGVPITEQPDKTMEYSGTATTVRQEE